MKQARLPALFRYGLAVVLTGVTVGVTMLMPPGEAGAGLVLFAVFLSAWFGGLGAGFLSTALFTSVILVHVRSQSATIPANRLMQIGMFAALGGGITLLIEALHLARRRSERNEAEARRIQTMLREREDALHEADERKNEFLAIVAHELRNPLAAIAGASQLLRTSTDPVDRRWSEEVISRQLGHLAHVVDDLLDVSRISRGKVLLRKELVDLRPILERAVDAVRSLIDERKHELTIVVGDAPLLLEADPTRVTQILVNLLTNAAKYTEPGGRIRVSAAQADKHIVIKVSDSGMGIVPEMLGRVFEMFAQSERAVDQSQGGLGIGLNLVRSLVELHGGTVTAASDGPGHGSEFTVVLPAAGSAGARPVPVTTPPSVGDLPRDQRPVLPMGERLEEAG
jgi:signal transduction histidine kinase